MLSQGMIKSTGRVLWNNDHLFYYRLEQNTVFTSLILIKYEIGPKDVFFHKLLRYSALFISDLYVFRRTLAN